MLETGGSRKYEVAQVAKSRRFRVVPLGAICNAIEGLANLDPIEKTAGWPLENVVGRSTGPDRTLAQKEMHLGEIIMSLKNRQKIAKEIHEDVSRVKEWLLFK